MIACKGFLSFKIHFSGLRNGVNNPKEYSTTKKEDNDDLKTDDTQRKHVVASNRLKFTTHCCLHSSLILEWPISQEEFMLLV